MALDDTQIRNILIERVDSLRQEVGIVVGILDSQGRRVIAHGKLDQDDPRDLNGDTIFEIGSLTKIFTSLLLVEMVQRGEVALADPVLKYLPSGTKVPERTGRPIRLVDLSTHTSGLPRLPSNLHPKNPANPYADYTPQKLYKSLSACKLTREIGSQFEYSNFGGGLLGFALARRAGMDYEGLVRARIVGPLQVSSTYVTLSTEMRKRLAVGHNSKLAAVHNWDFSVLAGAGALRSSANDMLTFLAATLGYLESPLAAAMSEMLSTRTPTGGPGSREAALGWIISSRSGYSIVWHNGGTGGYRSFLGYNPEARVGVVVLSNTFTVGGVDDIGMGLLDPHFPSRSLGFSPQMGPVRNTQVSKARPGAPTQRSSVGLKRWIYP